MQITLGTQYNMGILYRNTNTTGKKLKKTSSWHLNRMQISLGTQYNRSGRKYLKKNQNTPRPSEHPRVIKASTRMILIHINIGIPIQHVKK